MEAGSADPQSESLNPQRDSQGRFSASEMLEDVHKFINVRK